jgi:hypothetical protein
MYTDLDVKNNATTGNTNMYFQSTHKSITQLLLQQNAHFYY